MYQIYPIWWFGCIRVYTISRFGASVYIYCVDVSGASSNLQDNQGRWSVAIWAQAIWGQVAAVLEAVAVANLLQAKKMATYNNLYQFISILRNFI